MFRMTILFILITSIGFTNFDPRFPPLVVIQKELLSLSDTLKKNSQDKVIKLEIKKYMLLEQFILNNGLLEATIEITKNIELNKAKLEEPVRDCLIYRAIDFQFNFLPAEKTWALVKEEIDVTTDDILKIKKTLTEKVFICLQNLNSQLKWKGPPYPLSIYDLKARKVAKTGIDLFNKLSSIKETQ